jgi:hypothetical protein
MKKEELKKHAGLIEKFVHIEAKKLRSDVPSTCAGCGGSAEGCSCPHECPKCHKEVCICEAEVTGATSMVYTAQDMQNAFESGFHCKEKDPQKALQNYLKFLKK